MLLFLIEFTKYFTSMWFFAQIALHRFLAPYFLSWSFASPYSRLPSRDTCAVMVVLFLRVMSSVGRGMSSLTEHLS